MPSLFNIRIEDRIGIKRSFKLIEMSVNNSRAELAVSKCRLRLNGMTLDFLATFPDYTTLPNVTEEIA